MSNFIVTVFLLLGALTITSAQTIQQVEYTSSSTDELLYKKFKTVESSSMRTALAEMTLRGEANLQNYTFRKAGRFKDRIEIVQIGSDGKIVFQLEILESTFLHFLNMKEFAKEQEEKYISKQSPLLTFADK